MNILQQNIIDILKISTIFIGLDVIFLYGNRAMMIKQVEDVQKSAIQMDIYGALVCYLLLVFGFYYFVWRERRSILYAFLLGMVIYGVYETTSKSVLTKWKWLTVFIDTLWGGILFASTNYFMGLI